jgi:hypothetical protein
MTLPIDKQRILCGFEALAQTISRFARDASGSFDNSGEVDGNYWNIKAELIASPGKVRNARRSNRGFGRYATKVDARAAEVLAFDEDDSLTPLGQSTR